MKEKWNLKYNSDEYYFGKEPNDFFKDVIDKLQPGKALFVGDGEGRNSVYAAKIGWDVDCIDISDIGKSKAEKLAAENNVNINYSISDALEHQYPQNYYDAIIIVYFHIEKELRKSIHSHFIKSLKKNGVLILLVYAEEHLKLNSTGPSKLSSLYSLDEIVEDFVDLNFELFCKEKISRIKKGKQQESIVIKFVGRKNG